MFAKHIRDGLLQCHPVAFRQGCLQRVVVEHSAHTRHVALIFDSFGWPDGCADSRPQGRYPAKEDRRSPRLPLGGHQRAEAGQALQYPWSVALLAAILGSGATAAFLLSDAANQINGASLSMDGGWTAA